MLQFELGVELVDAEEGDHVVGLQHPQRLDELFPPDPHLRVLAVLVEVLHELLQEGRLLVLRLVRQQHDLYVLSDLVQPLLYV